nr:hypothetical protein HEP87_46660 [Streptomyces sp. S1D4-11]
MAHCGPLPCKSISRLYDHSGLTAEEVEPLPSEEDVRLYSERGWYLPEKLLTDAEVDTPTEASERYYAGQRGRELPTRPDRLADWTPADGEVQRNNDYIHAEEKSNIVSRHFDKHFWPTCSSDEMLTAFIPFHDCTEKSGTITMVNGSHRRQHRHGAARSVGDPRDVGRDYLLTGDAERNGAVVEKVPVHIPRRPGGLPHRGVTRVRSHSSSLIPAPASARTASARAWSAIVSRRSPAGTVGLSGKDGRPQGVQRSPPVNLRLQGGGLEVERGHRVAFHVVERFVVHGVEVLVGVPRPPVVEAGHPGLEGVPPGEAQAGADQFPLLVDARGQRGTLHVLPGVREAPDLVLTPADVAAEQLTVGLEGAAVVVHHGLGGPQLRPHPAFRTGPRAAAGCRW